MKMEYLFIFISFGINACASESSIKWDVMTKFIKIGDEAILNCNVNACLYDMQKTWLGGKHYDLLCYGNISTNPSKYEILFYNTTSNSRLVIKEFNFLDLNCEYTCACGFNQCTKMLKLEDLDFVYGDVKDSSKRKADRLHVDVEMKVYPLPNCSILYKDHSKSVEYVTSNRNVSEPYTVTIRDSLDVEPFDCKLLVNLTCQIGSSKYHVSVLEIDTCKEFEDIRILNNVSRTIIGVIIVIVIISILLTIKFENVRILKIAFITILGMIIVILIIFELLNKKLKDISILITIIGVTIVILIISIIWTKRKRKTMKKKKNAENLSKIPVWSRLSKLRNTRRPLMKDAVFKKSPETGFIDFEKL